MITKSDAVHELTEGSFTVSSAGMVKYEDNCITIPTESEIQTKLKELEAEYDANQYQRDRQYPSIGNQLDMQYHDQLNGTTTWKDAIAKVKADNPKPE